MRILLAGASGLIGSALRRHFKKLGHEVTLLIRPGGQTHPADAVAEWDPNDGRFNSGLLAGQDAVFCLSGHNLMDGRWTKQVKQLILDSRVRPVNLLARGIADIAEAQPDKAPRLFFSASAVGYYGHTPFGQPLAESAPAGQGFLAEVCRQWEAAAAPALSAPGVRTVIMRTGFVVAMDGGALSMTVQAFKRGLGGVLGNGKQAISWIALADLLDAVVFTVDHPDLSGPMNYVAPGAVDNREFTKVLAAELHKSAMLPIPGLAARAKFGEVADELLLNGQHVAPAKLQAAGFRWQYPDFASAIHAALQSSQ